MAYKNTKMHLMRFSPLNGAMKTKGILVRVLVLWDTKAEGLKTTKKMEIIIK